MLSCDIKSVKLYFYFILKNVIFFFHLYKFPTFLKNIFSLVIYLWGVPVLLGLQQILGNTQFFPHKIIKIFFPLTELQCKSCNILFALLAICRMKLWLSSKYCDYFFKSYFLVKLRLSSKYILYNTTCFFVCFLSLLKNNIYLYRVKK